MLKQASARRLRGGDVAIEVSANDTPDLEQYLFKIARGGLNRCKNPNLIKKFKKIVTDKLRIGYNMGNLDQILRLLPFEYPLPK